MRRLDASGFQEAVAEGNHVVEFVASWCVDCKKMAAYLPDLEGKYGQSFQFAQLDVDDDREVAEQYDVKGVPAFLVFQNGQETGRLKSKEIKTQEQIDSFFRQLTE
jgi:thioredoxin-like negative regulator of GroEL